ncbi:hypothetical protein ACHAQA_002375 [Verticillium albo-atrum]
MIRQSHSRLIPAAEEILHVFRMTPNLEATLQNATLTFATYMAALVFLENFAAEHSHQSEGNMEFLMGVLISVGRKNAMVASLANQLAIDMHQLGIKSALADKVIRLTNIVAGHVVLTVWQALEFYAPRLAGMTDSLGVSFCMLHGLPRDDAHAGDMPDLETLQAASMSESQGQAVDTEPAYVGQLGDGNEIPSSTILELPPIELRLPHESMTW